MAAKKKTKTRTLTAELEPLLEAFDLENSRLEDSVNDQAWQDKEHFMKEWLEAQDEDTPLSVDQIQLAEDAVWEALQQDYADSITFKRGEALVDAAQYLADQADIESTWTFDRDTGIVSVTIDKSFLKAWGEATEGVGFVAWDSSLGLSDVKGVASVIGVLDDRANVYGMRRFERTYEDNWDRWEPGGSQDYRSLTRLADEAAGL